MWAVILFYIPCLRKEVIKNSAKFLMVLIPLFLTVNFKDTFYGSRFSSSFTEYSIGRRMGWWAKGLSLLAEKSSFMGLGPGGFKHYMDQLGIPHAHNIHLSFLFDFGVIGFAALVAFIIYMTVKFYKVLSAGKRSYAHTMLWGSAAGLLAMGVHGVLDG